MTITNVIIHAKFFELACIIFTNLRPHNMQRTMSDRQSFPLQKGSMGAKMQKITGKYCLFMHEHP